MIFKAFFFVDVVLRVFNLMGGEIWESLPGGRHSSYSLAIVSLYTKIE